MISRTVDGFARAGIVFVTGDVAVAAGVTLDRGGAGLWVFATLIALLSSSGSDERQQEDSSR